MNEEQQVEQNTPKQGEQGVKSSKVKMKYLVLFVLFLFIMVVVLITFLPSKKEETREIVPNGSFEEAGEDGNPKGWTTKTRRIEDVD